MLVLLKDAFNDRFFVALTRVSGCSLHHEGHSAKGLHMIAQLLKVGKQFQTAEQLGAKFLFAFLELVRRFQRELGMAVIIITHDLGVVADIADRVMVMYAGRPVEQGDRDTTYYRAHHPYSEGLLESIPVPGGNKQLTPISGQPPSLINLPSGCSYHPRCRYAMDRCRAEIPTLYTVDNDPAHRSACFLPTTGEWHAARARTAHAAEVDS